MKLAEGDGGGGAYTGPGSRQSSSASLALQSARPESSHLLAVDGAQSDPAAAAAGAASSITRRMPSGEGTAGSPRRFSASDRPGNPLHTHSSRQRSWGLQRSLARPAPAPGSSGQRGIQAEKPRRRSRRRAKAAPRRMQLRASPYAERLQRARASLCAAPASPRRVGARRRLSLRLLPFVPRRPPPRSAPSRRRLEG